MDRYKIYLDVAGTIGHIGGDLRGIGVEDVNEYAHSDTLFSALIHGLAQAHEKSKIDTLFSEFEAYNRQRQESLLPFSCSSAFLSNREIDFVPRPLCPPPFNKEVTGLNKIHHISYDNLKKWLPIEPVEWTADTIEEFAASLFKDDKEFYPKLFFKRVRAVNAKGRLRNMTQVFHRGEVVYGENTWLYFWLDVQSSWWPFIKTALDSLTQCGGLGGDTTIGFSEIKKYESHPAALPMIANPNRYYLLSLLPLSEQVNCRSSFYNILNRKSWVNSPFIAAQYKKKVVKMFCEGSCLQTSDPHGELVNVTPNFWDTFKEDKTNWHRIYRNGLGFFIGY